jgi:hypothetical protein
MGFSVKESKVVLPASCFFMRYIAKEAAKIDLLK